MMNMTLNSSYLEAFYVCAQLRHFTKAAEKLHITQSALSQRIKNLEEYLEVTLIVRDRAGMRLTEQGENLLRYCQTNEQLEKQMIGSLKANQTHQLSGEIRIGGFSSVVRSVILPSLSDLLKDNPEVRIKIVTKELYELRSMLKSGEIDFMILDEKIENDNINAQVLGYEENVLIKKQTKHVPEIYLDHDESDLTTVRFLKLRSSKGLNRIYLDDIYGIIDGVKLGLGYAVVPRHLVENEKVIQIVDNRVQKNPVVLHFYDLPIYSKLHQKVVQTLRENCSKMLT